MVRADVVSTHHERPSGVADCLQRSDNPVGAASSEISAVFKSDPTRSAFSDNPDRLEIEAAALAFDAFAFGIGAGDVLARGRSDDSPGEKSEVGNNSICRECSDIVIDQNPRIVLGIKRAAPRHEFAGRDGLESGAMETKRPAAGRRAEKVENRQGAHLRPLVSTARRA